MFQPESRDSSAQITRKTYQSSREFPDRILKMFLTPWCQNYGCETLKTLNLSAFSRNSISVHRIMQLSVVKCELTARNQFLIQLDFNISENGEKITAHRPRRLQLHSREKMMFSRWIFGFALFRKFTREHRKREKKSGCHPTWQAPRRSL